MSTPEKASPPMQKPPSGTAPAPAGAPPRPAPKAPTAPPRPGLPVAGLAVAAATTPPVPAATGPRLIQPVEDPAPVNDGTASAPKPRASDALNDGASSLDPRPKPRASDAPAVPALSGPASLPRPRAPMASVASAAPSSVNITDATPGLSEPQLAHIARVMQGRDPEASLDIPPPADVAPPEDRAPDASDPYIGTTFDHRYKIQRLLGEGGMGFVYLARHKVIDKKVAVKVLRADLAKDREILDRFLQEAKAASSIGNPHIVDISDFGDLPDGSTYFVMEYLEGKSLSQLVDSSSRLPVERICHIGLQICDGLSAAHARGIVHRDLKPDNVYLVERGADHDFIKVLDFGIAKVSGNANTKLTKAGAVFGTPHYMSPEQAAGSPVDHRTDIYALGVMLYEMVSGQLPFNADNFMGILTQHMYKAPVPIRALVPGPECPPSLEAVVLKCLSKKPEARYQSMDDLAADLERVKSGGVAHAVAEMMARSGGFNVPADYFKHPSVIVPATPPTKQTKWPRYAGIAGAGAAVVIVGAIFVISGITNGTPAPRGSSSAAAPPPPVASVTATAVAPVVPAPPKKTAVKVYATPDTAAVFRDGAPVNKVACSHDGTSNGTACWMVDVEDGKPATIEIRADNYDSQTRTLDGTEPSTMVLLSKKGGRGGGPLKGGAGKVPVAKKGGKGSGDVVDPWNH
jgi:eukaryotic-like serine/threonine-protein kinase